MTNNNSLETLIKDTVHTLLIDVRTAEEYNTLNAKNSINIDSHNIAQEIEFFKKHEGKNFVLYCRSGMRSANAIKILQQQGITRLYNAESIDYVLSIQQQ